MWHLGNRGEKAVNLSCLIHIFTFVITCHLLFAPALEAKDRKPSRKPHGKPHGNQEQALKSKIAKMRHSPKITNGNSTFSDSMCLIMVEDNAEYYEWDFTEYTSTSGLVISDRCVITLSLPYVDFTNSPPTPDIGDPASYTCYVPRDGCDTAYHLSEFVLSKTSAVDVYHQNDIAIFKTQKSMEIGKSICGQYPLFPAAISCDRNGPPGRYSDCFLVGWGDKSFAENTPLRPQAEIQPNRIRVTTLTLPECEAVRNADDEGEVYRMNPSSQACVKTVDGNNGHCSHDYNSVLYCKYWGNKTGGWGQGSEGWGGFHQGWQNPNNGDGWGKPSFEPQQILAVGQFVYYYGGVCETDNSASLILKFGYEGYSDLFASCGMTCSDSLPKGYECMEKWDRALGPVYCTPQKIQHNNGWKAEHRRNPTHH